MASNNNYPISGRLDNAPKPRSESSGLSFCQRHGKARRVREVVRHTDPEARA